VKPNRCRELNVSIRRFEDPPVNVAAALVSHEVERGGEQFGADSGHLVAVVRVHHQFERPRVVAAGDLRVPDGVVVVRLPGEKTRETVATPLGKVEPEVVREGPVPIGAFGRADEFTDVGDLGGVQLPLDDQSAHPRRVALEP
jgi:hypothetical protein